MELSYFETLQMINLSIDRLESVFEFWLSATFAAIVASHLAGEKLTKIYAGMLTSIYLIFTFSVVVRSMAWNDALERYSKMLRTLRGDLSESATLDLVSVSIWATIFWERWRPCSLSGTPIRLIKLLDRLSLLTQNEISNSAVLIA